MVLSQPPRPGREWMPAMESQLQAIRVVQKLLDSSTYNVIFNNWKMDQIIMQQAQPFFWACEPTQAVFALATKIPADAQLNSWNLNTSAVWWYFDHPLAIQTTSETLGAQPIKALSMGWISNHFMVAVWTTDPLGEFGICPSQTWFWKQGESLEHMLIRTRAEHQELYGPGGRFEKSPQVGVDVFMAATEKISRFVLGAMLWLTQKVSPVETSDGHIERHRRKELQRTLKTKDVSYVKVVHLRRREHTESEHTGEKRDYSVRFLVEGHVRNQAVGPGRTERRLVWVSSYIKGPDDKPFRAPSHKVYSVSR